MKWLTKQETCTVFTLLIGFFITTHSGVCGYVCVWCTFCVCTVSPPAQQVEEDEDDVQVEGEGSGDVLLRIQTETEQPHHQLTVQHQKLVQKKKRQRESTGHGFKIQLHVSFNSDSYRTEIRSCNDGHKSSIFPYQWIEQGSQTAVGHISDVGVVEGADESKHDQVHGQNQQGARKYGEIKTGLR